jgi:hypothetical protein
MQMNDYYLWVYNLFQQAFCMAKTRLTQRALDGWYAPRFFDVLLSFERIPFLSLVLASRQ